MKNITHIMALALAIVMLIQFDTLAQQQTGYVASQGGGSSSGGNYTQFSVVGAEPVEYHISGGNFSGQAGFLYRNFLTFIPAYTISGNVVNPEGNPVTAGSISLMKDENGTKIQLASISLDSKGSFSFPEIREGTYTLKVVPTNTATDQPPLLSTYLGGTQTPKEAALFKLMYDTTFVNLPVLREAAPAEDWKGSSSISGILVENKDDGNEGGRLLAGLRTQAGTPMANAQVFLTDPESKTIKFSRLTDKDGNFRFDNIAARKFGFLVEHEGQTFEMAETIDLSSGNTAAEITAVVSEEGMTSTVEQVVTGIEEEMLKNGYVLYPNPVKDKLHIKITGLKPSPLEIKVLDLQGRILMSGKMQLPGESLEEEIELSQLPNGLYLVTVRQGEYLLHRKIIKQ